MPTINDVIAEIKSVAMPPIKTKKDLLLEASSSKHSARFVYAKVDLTKLPMLAVGDPDGPLVIDVNASGLRKTKSGFMPRIIIMSGSEKARVAKKSGSMTCQAWLGEKIIRHKELKSCAVTDGGSASLSDVLLNSPSGDKAIIQEKLLDKPNSAGPTLGGFTTGQTYGGFDVRNYGAPGSELNNPMMKTMLNVEEALAMYQNESAIGVHKVVFSPYAAVPPGLINAGREAKIAAESAGVDLAKFSVMDFLKWQHNKIMLKAAQQRKNINGRELEASQFAYVGDVHDISTWHGVLNSSNTLADLKLIPKSERNEALRKLEAAGGPHLGKGGPAKKHIDKLHTRDVKQGERKSLAKKGKALPDGSFPIANKKDLSNAKHAVGRAKNPGKAKAFINKRAKQLGVKKIGAVAPPMTQSINSRKK